MPRDRMGDLKKKEGAGAWRTLLPRKAPKGKKRSPEEFLRAVNKIDDDLLLCKGDFERLRRLHLDCLADPRNPQLSVSSIELSRSLIKRIRELFVRIKNLEDDPSFTYSPKPSLLSSLSTLRQSLLDEEEAFKKKQIAACGGYLRILGLDLPSAEIEDAVEGGHFDDVVRQMMRGDRKELVADVKGRGKAILALEKDIEDLKDMYEDLHNCAESQGITVDRIETRTSDAAEHVRKGKKELDKAKKTRNKWMKRLAKGGVIAAIAVVVLVVLLVAL